MNYGVKASFEIWGLLVPSFGSQPRRELTCRFTPESMGRQSSSPKVGQVISTIVIISASSPPSSRLVSSPPLSSCTNDLASAATSACPRITTQHRHRRQPRALPEELHQHRCTHRRSSFRASNKLRQETNNPTRGCAPRSLECRELSHRGSPNTYCNV
jgi:hypothetical protein